MKKLNCILLIDDDRATNIYHNIILKEADCAECVEIATDGIEALEYLRAAAADQTYPRPSLIFLDINMPGMNGWEFLEEYQKLPEQEKRQVVIMMLTTSLNPDDQERALAIREVSGFRTKPLSKEMLQEIFQAHFSEVGV